MNINPNWPRGKALLERNHAILRERYGGVFISKAQELGEWIIDSELRWLGGQAKKCKLVIEVGSWFGKSARVIADNLPKDGILICVDHWLGSQVERDTNHTQAKELEGDFAYFEFCKNLWDHIIIGKVIPLRMHGKNAAKFLLEQGVKADMVWIDAGHTYAEVKEDIYTLLPLRKQGGIICGHDYMQQAHPDVTAAVLDTFGNNVAQVPEAHIWTTDSFPIDQIPVLEKSKVFDCFIFNNELDILDQRFETLFDVVDRFIIVESSKTHGGKDKELVFHNNLQRFEKYLHKVTYLVFTNFPTLPENASIEDKSWAIERAQRDEIMKGLTECKDNDTIMISDVDEIPNPQAIQSYKPEDKIKAFDMVLYYYNKNVKAVDPWREAKIAPYSLVKQYSPCGIRYSHVDAIPNGGEHLSYFGGVESIIQKIENTAHQTQNTDYFKNPERIKKCIENGVDIFERDYIKYEKI